MLPDTKTKQASIFNQLIDLFLMELTNWRWSWRAMVLTGMLTPLISIFALGTFARGSGEETLAYILTGNVVLAIMFGNMDNIQSHFVFLRFMGALDYFATLPVRRFVLILAMVMAFFLLSLPALLVTILVGSLFLDVSITFNPLIFIVMPLCAIPMAGIGAFIGAYARTIEEAGSISMAVTLVMAGIGPVIIPPDHLPDILLLIGRLSPATYAASALRQTLLGPTTSQIIVDLLVLVILSVLVFSLVNRRMDWQNV